MPSSSKNTVKSKAYCLSRKTVKGRKVGKERFTEDIVPQGLRKTAFDFRVTK